MLYAAIRSILQVGSSAYGKVGRMSKDESIVRRPREPFSDASLSQNADELANFMWSGPPRSKWGWMGELSLTSAARFIGKMNNQSLSAETHCNKTRKSMSNGSGVGPDVCGAGRVRLT